MPRIHRTCDEVLSLLKQQADPVAKAGMARFGVSVESALGVSMPKVRAIAGSTVKDHGLAEELWQSGIHEARIAAALVDKPEWVTREQCERWALDFSSWDVVDQVTGNLFDKTPFADDLVRDWSERDEEFVKRAAYALIAWMAVHQKKRADAEFLTFLPVIEREAGDDRNFVKKAVNWALRQIGKRSAELQTPALKLARKLAASDDRAKRWSGNDAVRELDSEKMRKRLGLL